MPIAHGRRSGNATEIWASARVSIAAAPAPCTILPTSSHPIDGASAHTTEPMPNSANPMMNTRLRPNRSPSTPALASKTA